MPGNFDSIKSALFTGMSQTLPRMRLAKTSLFVVALCATLALCGCCKPDKTYCLVTYNIRNGVGMDGSNNLQRISEVLNRCGADVVALQEIDSMTVRSGGKDVLGELASLTGMIPLYAPAIDFDGGKYGVGILCRKPPLSIFRAPLPGPEERRTIIAAEFDDYVFACTHLSLTEEGRMQSLPAIADAAKRIQGKLFFLAGDFNASPGESFVRELSKSFGILSDTTRCTFPADNPVITIDYIALFKETDNSSLKVRQESFLEETSNDLISVSSDHRPIVLTIKNK